VIDFPWPRPNEDFEKRMCAFVENAKSEGVEAFAFGDLFLEDIRAYREKNLDGTGITLLFPVWGMPTDRLAHDMVAGGLRAHVTCVDPCGENGEFHTCVFQGPMFSKPVPVTPGEVQERDGLVFADLILMDEDRGDDIPPEQVIRGSAETLTRLSRNIRCHPTSKS